jgi:outer membrane receptor protein involved in Fe transport
MRLNQRLASVLLLGASALALSAGSAFAQATAAADAAGDKSNRVLETVVVTAEKREASVQDVPIAISAFSEAKLDRLQIQGATDIQRSIPNFQFSKGNFTGSNVAIRGIGSKLVAASGDGAVGIHQNGVPLTASAIFETEFYDVQRVEVLRGPQGTLYGRNATGGVLNIISNKAKLADEMSAGAEITGGNYKSLKGKGFLNLPLTENVALRLAGFYTSRDGYTDIVAGPNNGGTVDGRNLYSLRASLFWEIGENTDLSIMAQTFNEDDDRSRISKQMCLKDTRPFPFSQGCLGTGLGFESPNTSASLGGIFTFLPAILGAPTFNLFPVGADGAAGAVNPPNLREVATGVLPTHKAYETQYQGELNHDFGIGKATVALAYQRAGVDSFVDYGQYGVTRTFSSTPLAPGGFVNDPFGTVSNTLQTYDRSQSASTQTTAELRFVSDLEGKFNYTIGGIYIDFKSSGVYNVFSNSLSYHGLRNQANGVVYSTDQWYYTSFTDYRLKAKAVFGEAYFQATDALKFTLGLRNTDDDKTTIARQTLFSRVGSSAAIPFVTQKAKFNETTGRVGFDWKIDLPFTDSSSLYAFASKGYKGGGVNPPQDQSLPPAQRSPETFAPEFVNSIELGSKNILADGRLVANMTLFNYDYEGYQVSKIVNRTSVNENIDAKLKGFEGEFSWEPVDRLVFDLTIGLLSSEIGNVSSIDVLDRTNGNPAFTVLKNLATAANCVVPTAAFNNAVNLANAGAFGPGVNGTSVALGACGGSFAALGVTPTDGTPKNLSGKKLPNTPSSTISLAAQYGWDINDTWSMNVNADVYWQAKSYARIFNGPTDLLPAYSLVNASVTFTNADAGLFATLFVKNIGDKAAQTDHYLTDDSSGLFTNVFLTEPRLFGVTVGKKW